MVKDSERLENKKRLKKSQIKTQVINLEELEKLSVDKQVKYFEDVFDKIYSGVEIESLRKYALRCIKLSCDPKDNRIHLPYGVRVQKKGNKLYIKVYRIRHLFLILLFITLLFFSILGASYSTVTYSIVKNLNKDIDGDGIPELNLDLNNDREAEVNIDTDGDNKPNLDIDYKGNREAIFNIDRNRNGKADFNLINQDTNGDGICDINCDLNKDGWPDINLDIDGDGRVDLEIDTDNDRKADLNFDMDMDMVCDLHCDTDYDNRCDKFCLSSQELDDLDPSNTGTSSNISSDMIVQSGELVLEFEDKGPIYITDIYPDDQPGYIGTIPTKRFRVTNKTTNVYIKYNLRWKVDINDFVTDNFKYKIVGTNRGISLDYRTAPKETSQIATEIMIGPGETQEYSIDFKLQGTGSKQNEDQGRTFKGTVEIYLDNEI